MDLALEKKLQTGAVPSPEVASSPESVKCFTHLTAMEDRLREQRRKGSCNKAAPPEDPNLWHLSAIKKSETEYLAELLEEGMFCPHWWR